MRSFRVKPNNSAFIAYKYNTICFSIFSCNEAFLPDSEVARSAGRFTLGDKRFEVVRSTLYSFAAFSKPIVLLRTSLIAFSIKTLPQVWCFLYEIGFRSAIIYKQWPRRPYWSTT